MADLTKTFRFSMNQPFIQDGCNINFDDIISYINDRNSGASSWDVVYAGHFRLTLKTSAPTAAEGIIYYNTTDKQFYGCKDGSTWSIIG